MNGNSLTELSLPEFSGLQKATALINKIHQARIAYSMDSLHKLFADFQLLLSVVPASRRDRILDELGMVIKDRDEILREAPDRSFTDFLVEHIKAIMREDFQTERLIELINNAEGDLKAEENECRRLIALGANTDTAVDYGDFKSFSLLHLCIARQKLHLFRVLVTSHAQINCADNHGRSPLQYLVYEGLAKRRFSKPELLKYVRALTRAGANLAHASDQWYTGYSKGFAMVFSLGINAIIAPPAGDHRGYTAAHLLAYYGKDQDIDLVPVLFNSEVGDKKEQVTHKTPVTLARSKKIQAKFKELMPAQNQTTSTPT